MPPPPVTPKKMPFEKYRPFLPLPVELLGRRWPSVRIEKAPLWVRSTSATATRLWSSRWTRPARCEIPLPVTKSTGSHHYKVLREAGIVQWREEGTRRYYTVRRADLETRFPGLLGTVLRAATTRYPMPRATSTEVSRRE